MKTKALSDKKLLANYMDGDQNAISVLIERHKKRVTDYIYIMVKDRAVADDVFQETFIKALQFIDQGRYTESGRFLSWVLRIAHNQVIDHFRQTKREMQLTEADAGYDILNTTLFSETNVEDKMVQAQIQKDVRKLIDSLPEEQKEVVMMRYYSGLSFQEIANQTGVSINTSLGRMRYALINMRKMIQENQVVLSLG